MPTAENPTDLKPLSSSSQVFGSRPSRSRIGGRFSGMYPRLVSSIVLPE